MVWRLPLLVAVSLLCIAWTPWQDKDPSEGRITLSAGGGTAEGYQYSWNVCGQPPVTRIPASARGAGFGLPHCPWVRSFPPAAPQAPRNPCSPPSLVLRTDLTSSNRSSSVYGVTPFLCGPSTTQGRLKDLPGPGGLLRRVPWFFDPAEPLLASPKTAPRVLPSAEWTASALRFRLLRGSIARPTPAAPQRFACRLAATDAWFTEKVVGSPLFLPGLSPGNIPPVSLAHPLGILPN